MASKVSALSKVGTTEVKIINRIVKMWDQTSDTHREQGAQWYVQVNSDITEIALTTGHSVETVAAVVAHLSPRVHWVKNVRGAQSLLTTGEAPGMLSACVNRAKAAIASAEPLSTINGPKTKAFAANLLNDPDAVTVDVWMCRAIGIEHEDLNKSGVYAAIADCFRKAAFKIGVTPSTLQAAVWIHVRGKAN